MSVIEGPFVTASSTDPLVDAGPTLTADELVTLATRALKRPESISVDEIRVLLFVFEAQTANRSQVAFLTGKIARVQVLEEFGGIKNLAHLLGVV